MRAARICCREDFARDLNLVRQASPARLHFESRAASIRAGVLSSGEVVRMSALSRDLEESIRTLKDPGALLARIRRANDVIEALTESLAAETSEAKRLQVLVNAQREIIEAQRERIAFLERRSQLQPVDDELTPALLRPQALG